jgi:outer membrane protein OmpA-like peptidoglycan-associated protein
VEILGHTDNDGSDLANDPLSQARAAAVRAALGSPTLDAVSFSARGVGSTAPITAGATEPEKERNRRASLHVAISNQPTGNRP